MFFKKKYLHQVLNLNDEILKTMAFERFYQNQNINEVIKFKKEHFVLFHYPNHFINAQRIDNLGDDIQSLAVKNALNLIYSNPKFEYFGRDYLSYYNAEGGGVVIMQGWFAHNYSFLPPKNLLPVFVGTHFSEYIQKYLLFVLARCPTYFQNKSIGCRDLYTLEFCQSLGLNAYFSRCLTLTLPKREPKASQNKIFFVNLPKEFLPFIPKDIKEQAEPINQQVVVFDRIDLNDDSCCLKMAESLLGRYKNEAKLIITSALHCAAPFVAMGISVILCRSNNEQTTRFSALNGILPIYTLDDFKKKQVDFNPKPLNIESLKKALFENLRLSIKEAYGETIDTNKLLEHRDLIKNFKI